MAVGVIEAVRAVPVSPAMVQQRASELVGSDARVLLLRAHPEWTAGPVKVGDREVRVVTAVSQLAVLDVYASLGPDDYAVILTDRPSSDLGDAVLARAYKQRVEMPDEWQAVPRLFPGAREVSRELRRLDWAATALLDHRPVGDWPRSPEIAVGAAHAIGALLAHLVGLRFDAELDGAVLLTALGKRDNRSRWADVDVSLRRHLIAWAGAELGAPAAFALKVAQRRELVMPLAVGLALDVLWPVDGSIPDELQIAARVRAERFVDGKTIPVTEATAVAAVARATVQRAAVDDDADIAVALKQAEALLGDLGWAIGAERSSVLRPGYYARERALAVALDSGTGIEDALSAVLEHRDANGVPTMAVRLHRWLAGPEVEPSSLAGDLQRQLNDGAWVDAALGAVCRAATDPVVAETYQRLVTKVRDRRAGRDDLAAHRLAQAATIGRQATPGMDAIGVERILGDVVEPLRRGGGALLVLLDGLSGAVAVMLASEIARLGFVEHVPMVSLQRLGAVAVLPTLTRRSRTSLFCGEVREGDADQEKKGLRSAFPGSIVFHKNDLRAESGAALPTDVASALADEKVSVVGVVINAIDDAIHKTDVSDTDWKLTDLHPLRALLEAAIASRRTVIVTSDHGHVVERGTEMLPAPGTDSRWRPVRNPVRPGEVEVSGPRVVVPDGCAVLLWREDRRYGPRRSGYHGGASLAEVTVPVLVFQPATALADTLGGWVSAPPQVPAWWNDPADGPALAPPVSRSRKKRKPAPAPVAGQDTLFAVEQEATPDPEADLVDALLASSAYANQHRKAGRHALSDDAVATFLRPILQRGGRAHQDTVAATAGIPAVELGQRFAVVKRLLNVDGYEVLKVDSDGVTYRIDIELLREQFELGGP